MSSPWQYREKKRFFRLLFSMTNLKKQKKACQHIKHRLFMALIRLARLGRKLYCEACITTYEKKFSSVSLNPVPGLNVFNSLSKKKSPVYIKHPNVLTW